MMADACLAPAADIGLVQGLLGSVDCNAGALSAAAYGALARPDSPVAAVLTALLTLYIGFIGFRLLIGRAPLRVSDLTISALKIGVVLTLATSWPTYQQLVFDTLFKGPAQLAASMLADLQPASGASAGDPFDGLQVTYDELQKSAAWFSQHSLSVVSPLQGGNGFAALALNVSAFLMLVTTLGAMLASRIVLGVLLGLGPLFVALLLFDTTRGLFTGWLRASIAFALAPLVAVLGLVVQLALVGPQLSILADNRAQGVVDAAPASAILLLTIVAAFVSIALGLAVACIAAGLRLPGASQSAANRAAPATGAGGSTAVIEVGGGYRALSSTSGLQQRAQVIAAAAAAMERRDVELLAGPDPSPRRATITPGRDTPGGVAVQAAPFGQSYRRSALPPRTVSSATRDE